MSDGGQDSFALENMRLNAQILELKSKLRYGDVEIERLRSELKRAMLVSKRHLPAEL